MIYQISATLWDQALVHRFHKTSHNQANAPVIASRRRSNPKIAGRPLDRFVSFASSR